MSQSKCAEGTSLLPVFNMFAVCYSIEGTPHPPTHPQDNQQLVEDIKTGFPIPGDLLIEEYQGKENGKPAKKKLSAPGAAGGGGGGAAGGGGKVKVSLGGGRGVCWWYLGPQGYAGGTMTTGVCWWYHDHRGMLVVP